MYLHATLDACYQLVQSVLKIGIAVAKKGDRGSCVALAWAFLSLSTKMGVDKAPAFLGAPFLAVLAVFVGRSVHWSEGPDHCKLTNEWVWQRS